MWRDRELAPGAGQVVLDLERLARRAPAEVGTHDLGDARGDGSAAVGQLLGQAGATSQDVVERERQFVADGKGHLGLEEVAPRDERPQQVQLRAQRDDGRGLRPVPVDQSCRRLLPDLADGRDRGQLAGDPCQGVRVGRADEPSLGGVAGSLARAPRARGRRR